MSISSVVLLLLYFSLDTLVTFKNTICNMTYEAVLYYNLPSPSSIKVSKFGSTLMILDQVHFAHNNFVLSLD